MADESEGNNVDIDFRCIDISLDQASFFYSVYNIEAYVLYSQ